MKILLDSHALVWFLTGSRRCTERAREAIDAPRSEVFVSAASAWEIATKVRAGKWAEATPIAEQIERTLSDFGFHSLPVTLEHGRVAGFLPGMHRDPFDRMLAAQSIVEKLPLVTADPAFRHFDVEVLW